MACIVNLTLSVKPELRASVFTNYLLFCLVRNHIADVIGSILAKIQIATKLRR